MSASSARRVKPRNKSCGCLRILACVPAVVEEGLAGHVRRNGELEDGAEVHRLLVVFLLGIFAGKRRRVDMSHT